IFSLILVGLTDLVSLHAPILTDSLLSIRRVDAKPSGLGTVFSLLVGFALVLPAIGGRDVLSRAAHELPPPRLRALQRISFFVAIIVCAITVVSSFLFVRLVPSNQATVWAATPLSGLAQNLQLPIWISGLMTILVLAAALTILIPATHAALDETEQLLS